VSHRGTYPNRGAARPAARPLADDQGYTVPRMADAVDDRTLDDLIRRRGSIRAQAGRVVEVTGLQDGELFEHELVFDVHESRSSAYSLGDALVRLDRQLRRSILLAMPVTSTVVSIRALGTDLLDFVEARHGNSVNAETRLNLGRLRELLNDNQGVLAFLALLQVAFGGASIESDVHPQLIEQLPSVVESITHEQELEIEVLTDDGTQITIRMTTDDGLTRSD
jgi:hypothetical protein